MEHNFLFVQSASDAKGKKKKHKAHGFFAIKFWAHSGLVSNSLLGGNFSNT